MKRFMLIGIFFWLTLLLVSCERSQREVDIGLSMEEIMAQIKSLSPKDEDFRFNPPAGWSENLLKEAKIVAASEGESVDSLRKIIDGSGATLWKSNRYTPSPEVLIDLTRPVQFNRLVIFNRFSESRGTGGGNNATRELQVWVSPDSNVNHLKKLATFTLSGPNPVCFKLKNKGQVCVFIDNKEPDIIETTPTTARLVKLVFKSAYWGEVALEEWKTSVALGEFMMFYAP